MVQGIEKLEMEGDWYEEIRAEELERERQEANEQAPVQPPPTDEEMQAHFEDWAKRHLIIGFIGDKKE
jgi:hypothetical protein